MNIQKYDKGTFLLDLNFNTNDDMVKTKEKLIYVFI